MKEATVRKIIRIIAVALLLAAWGITPTLASGPDPVPLCYPNPCFSK